jgi:GxxExxY protein
MDTETKATRAAAKKLEKEAKAAEKQKQKETKKATLAMEKALKKMLEPPKKRGRPTKAPVLTEAPPKVDMPPYAKLDVLRGFAEEVCASLGAGHLESIYHAAMAVELRLAGIQYESERVMPVTHKGSYVGTVRADIIVEKDCVLEFKISGKIDDAKQQARQYMKLRGIAYGFVIMFPKTDGGKVQFVDARLPDEE